MDGSRELHVVFGAGGGAGSALVRELSAQGKRVRAVNRGGTVRPGLTVEPFAADVLAPGGAQAAVAGATVVYNCVGIPYVDWQAQMLPITRSILEAAAAVGAPLVFADNTYMYGSVSAPLTEELPSRPVSRKGELRARMAEVLMEAHSRGVARVAIGRAGSFYGPDVHASLLPVEAFAAALAGKRVNWFGRLNVPHTLMYIDDMARGLATLGAHPEALGQIWHLPHAAPLTGREFLELIFAESGQTPKIGVLPRQLIKLAGLFDAQARELLEMLYQLEAPFLVDSGKFERAFGWGATPFREGARRTLASLRAARSAAPAPSQAAGAAVERAQ